MNTKWIDTHAHLNDEAFEGRIEQVLAAAADSGVTRVIVIGIDAASSSRAVELAEQYLPINAVVGIQPNSLAEIQTGDWERIVELAASDKVVGIGETGMDRYWDRAPIELQRAYFVKHLQFADQLGRPVVIHCRDADPDVVAVLTDFSCQTGRPVNGVMHSFTGDAATALACLDLGLCISFAGMVTYKKNEALREVARTVPLDRLLVETDSPYLAPHPHRGKQNQPCNVVHTGACLAQLKDLPIDDLASATTANAVKLFRLTLQPPKV